jgi:hypothetical protein
MHKSIEVDTTSIRLVDHKIEVEADNGDWIFTSGLYVFILSVEDAQRLYEEMKNELVKTIGTDDVGLDPVDVWHKFKLSNPGICPACCTESEWGDTGPYAACDVCYGKGEVDYDYAVEAARELYVE